VCAARQQQQTEAHGGNSSSAQYELLDAGPAAVSYTLTATLDGQAVGRVAWEATAPSQLRLGCAGAAAAAAAALRGDGGGDLTASVRRMSVLTGSGPCACEPYS
jgi:hypothetical protein